MTKSKVRLELGEVTVHNIGQLKRVNQVVFPVSYNERFYKDVVGAGELARLAFFNDVAVGGVCCRLEPAPGPTGNGGGTTSRPKVYIMTLGCLGPYRRRGLGALMVEHVVGLAEREGASEVYLHVQVSNAPAIQFYQRHGFRIAATETSYYKRITPADAYVLQRSFSPKDAAEESPNTQRPSP